MAIEPLGVSGEPISGGTGTTYTGTYTITDPATGSTTTRTFSNTVPGKVYELGRWRGFSLRQIVIGVVGNDLYLGRLQITEHLPNTLDPELAPPWAKFDLPIFVANGTTINIPIEAGLVTVLPHERIYIVVYDWKTPSTSPALKWSVNLLWEPWKEAK